MPMQTCVICTELMLDIRRGVLPCGHEYCAECIKSWAACSNTCPLCKAPFRTISEHTASGRKKRVRVDNAELEVSYGPEEFAEEMYGDAQYDEEAEAAEQNMLLGVNFVGFGLSHYNEAEDSSFASSDAQSNSDELALEDDDDEDDDDDDDEDEDDDDDDDDDNDEDEGSSSLPSIVGASGGDALAHVWNSRRDSNFADSSSATPVAPRRTRRGVGNRRRAPPSPPMRLRSRQNQPVDIDDDDNDDDDDDDDDEDFEDDDDDVVLSPRPRRQTAAYNMAPPPRREPPRPGNRGNDSRAMNGRRVQPQRRAAATRAERQRASSPPAPSPGVDIDLVSNETPVAGRRGLRQRNRGGSPSSDVDLDLFTPN